LIRFNHGDALVQRGPIAHDLQGITVLGGYDIVEALIVGSEASVIGEPRENNQHTRDANAQEKLKIRHRCLPLKNDT
jgi:hypothetical protein